MSGPAHVVDIENIVLNGEPKNGARAIEAEIEREVFRALHASDHGAPLAEHAPRIAAQVVSALQVRVGMRAGGAHGD